jgi:integrase
VVLEQAVDDALKQGLVVRNVVRLVRKPHQRRTEMKIWTAEQLATFLRKTASDRYGALWRIAAFGLRRSETVGLRWQDVVLDGASIRVAQTRVSIDGKRVATGEPKTAAGQRTVPIDPATVAALRGLTAKQAAERLAAGEACGETGGLIAVDETGRPIRPEVFGASFKRIAKAAGLPEIRTHDLRHMVASLLHESGSVSLRTLAAILGHADAGFTLRTYAYSSDEALTAASATLASLFETPNSAVL